MYAFSRNNEKVNFPWFEELIWRSKLLYNFQIRKKPASFALRKKKRKAVGMKQIE